MNRLILASASPRRKELVKLIDSSAVCAPSYSDESVPDGLDPREVPRFLAEIKAQSVAKKYPMDTVLGFDTGVFIDGKMLGKPSDAAQAADMLRLLSARTHEVITGCCIIVKGRTVSFSESTKVEFFELGEMEIAAYISTDEPYDKAGGYGIQGKAALFVRGIRGDYYNVVGMPVAAVSRALSAFAADSEAGRGAENL